MHNESNRRAVSILILFTLLVAPALAAGQDSEYLLATTKGEGKIDFGHEQFKINTVIVKLLKDGKAEIRLMTDIQVLITGKWSADGAEKGIDLDITGTVTDGRLEGGGKLFLSDDRKSIASLSLEVVNKFTKKTIKVDFEAK